MKRIGLAKGPEVVMFVFIALLIILLGNSGLASEVYDLNLGTTDSKSGMMFGKWF